MTSFYCLFVNEDFINSLNAKQIGDATESMFGIGELNIEDKADMEELLRYNKADKKKRRLKLFKCVEKTTKDYDILYSVRKLCAGVALRNWMIGMDKVQFRAGVAKMKEVKIFIRLSKKVFSGMGIDPTRGCKEAMYQKALAHELMCYFGTNNGAMCMERSIPVWYPPKPYYMTAREALLNNHINIGMHNRMDLEYNSWIFELKSIDHLNSSCINQLRNYIRQTEYTKGILINFSQKTGCVEWKLVFSD